MVTPGTVPDVSVAGQWHSLDVSADPFMDWFGAIEPSLKSDPGFIRERMAIQELDQFGSSQEFRSKSREGEAFDNKEEKPDPERIEGRDSRISIPILAEMANPNWDDFLATQRPVPGPVAPKDEVWLTSPEDVLPEDTDTDFDVLIGNIDSGIPLGHRRFRTASGHTRVLAAWQQSALWAGRPGVNSQQPFLPFGQELTWKEIDAALTDPAHLAADGTLDTSSFNRALSLVEPLRQFGQRDLDHRVAHGAHMADLAAGAEPGTDLAERSRIIAVNLPPQYLHGTAGNFLQYYAAFAIRRIVAHAEGPDDAVTRTWTLNALSSSGAKTAVAGYRGSDGAPADYSSTGQVRGKSGREAAFPSEDASSLFGILSSGAQDGTMAALRGTSASSAMASRDEALRVLGKNTAVSTPDPAWTGRAAEAKVGARGRIRPVKPAPSRTGYIP